MTAPAPGTHDDRGSIGMRCAVDDVVDAHVHVWRPERANYPWLADVPQLARPFDLDDVGDEQAALGVRQVVLVQAADNIDDTTNMLLTARAHPMVAGVVAWVPMRDAKPARDSGRRTARPLGPRTDRRCPSHGAPRSGP